MDGRQGFMRCPLHDEATPSFGIDLETGRWYCFGCGRGGGLEDLVTMLVGDEMCALAVIHRARSYDGPVSIPEWSQGSPQEVVPADPSLVWSRYQKVDWLSIPKENPACDYLVRQRRFQRRTLDAFDVRLTYWAEYPIVFPIREDQELVGYVRRRIDAGEPKYLYNEGFKNGSVVAYYCVSSEAPCLVVEGVLDLMKAAQHGALRVAALLGWRFSAEKGRKLESLGVERSSQVVCALDNTPTGRDGYDLMRVHYGSTVRRFEYPGLHKKDICDLNEYEFWRGMPDITNTAHPD